MNWRGGNAFFFPAISYDILAADFCNSILPKTHAPDLIEGISYKMLSYGDGKDMVFALNAQKHYVSLYVGDANKIDPEGSLLEGLSVGKGCIRFSKTKDVSKTRIGEFIQRAVELWRRGEDVYC